jgi:GTP-binding protein
MFDITIRFAPGEERQAIRLVDLPGYGYAKGPKEDRLSWKTLVEGYVRSREALKTMLLLVDARRELGEEEVQLCDWLAAEGLPCHVVITKSDKLGATERGLLVKARKEELRGRVSSVSMVSALKSEGIEDVWKKIAYDLRATP